MGDRIDTKSGRARLPVRREPHWHRLSKGRYLGYRKLDSSVETWIARFRDEMTRRQLYNALGDLSDVFGFDKAKQAAERWFADLDRGITGQAGGSEATVEVACQNYVVNRRKVKGEACAHDADMRFKRTVLGDGKAKRSKYARPPIASIALAKLRAPQIREWRDGLKMSKAAANRTLIALKAALNLAVKDRLVSFDRTQEWRFVEPDAGVVHRRTLYLDLPQRRALLAECQGAFADLVQAAVLTGCRPGELTRAPRSAFDARTKTLRVCGKTGARDIPLSDPAVELFKRTSRSKLPTAPLLSRDDAKPWAHSDSDELLREAAQRAGLPQGVCLYTMRHSFITAALLDGMSTLEVARLVGTSLPMIEKHYGHLAISSAREKLARVTLL